MKRSTKQRSVVVVTGAAAGIGYSTAETLLKGGWSVVGIDLKVQGLRRLQKRFGNACEFVEGDVANRATHEQAATIAASLGRICGWVNNAGVERPTRAHDYSQADFDLMTRVNLAGYAHGCAVACQTFMKRKVAGAIVNVSSIRSCVAFPSGFVYEATKGAVDAMTRQIAVEYGHLGIRCNGVRPGCIMTPLSEQELKASDDPEKLLQEWADLHPLSRRIGKPEEVAAAIEFLLSEKASFISGALLNVDGAATARCYAFPPDKSI